MIPVPMEYSKFGLELTKNFEGCKLTAYQDSGGVWTNGYGNTHGVFPGSTITQDEAETDLWNNLQNSVNDVNRLVNIQLTQSEFDALVDFDFNEGRGHLAGSTLLRLINEGDISDASSEFQKWDMCAGSVISGLLRRRLAEKAEFTS